MIQKVLQSRLFTIFLFGAIGVLGFSVFQTYRSGKVIEIQVNNLNKKIEEAKKQTEELANLNKNADNQSFLERQIKQKLNYKRPDEKVVFIYKNPYNQKLEQSEQPVETQTDQLTPVLTLWQKFMNWLKSL